MHRSFVGLNLFVYCAQTVS